MRKAAPQNLLTIDTHATHATQSTMGYEHHLRTSSMRRGRLIELNQYLMSFEKKETENKNVSSSLGDDGMNHAAKTFQGKQYEPLAAQPGKNALAGLSVHVAFACTRREGGTKVSRG